MPKLHIANTFFEWELETEPNCSLAEGFHQHAIFCQLQFLPALYASVEDGLLVSDLPEESYWSVLQQKNFSPPKVCTLSDDSFSPFTEIESWGASRLIAEFADKHQLTYRMPDWEVVKKVNSKQFSFEYSPKLSHATLLYNEADAKQWLGAFPGTKVFKTCYGVSGKGHLIIDNQTSWERITRFLRAQWGKKLPVIAEPWVQRLLDFSTQWTIDPHKSITYIGATLCENNERGEYRFNTVGNEQTLFSEHFSFLQEHLRIVRPILSKIADLGYFGNIGIDAMIYSLSNIPTLHAIVEINARKTMGWVALMMQKKYPPESILRFCYSPEIGDYLPQTAGKFSFKRNLAILPRLHGHFENQGRQAIRRQS